MSQRLFWGTVKEFSDGAVAALTALMHEPYPKDPSTSGVATIDFDDLATAAAGAQAACIQVPSADF